MIAESAQTDADGNLNLESAPDILIVEFLAPSEPNVIVQGGLVSSVTDDSSIDVIPPSGDPVPSMVVIESIDDVEVTFSSEG